MTLDGVTLLAEVLAAGLIAVMFGVRVGHVAPRHRIIAAVGRVIAFGAIFLTIGSIARLVWLVAAGTAPSSLEATIHLTVAGLFGATLVGLFLRIFAIHRDELRSRARVRAHDVAERR